MNRLPLVSISTLTGALLATLSTLQYAPAPSATGTTPRAHVQNAKIAVVDPRAVRKKSQWARELLAAVDKEARKNAAQLQDIRNRRTKLRKELEFWTAGSREHLTAQLEINMLTARLQDSHRLYRGLQNKDLANVLVQVREKLQRVVDKLAKQRGYDLVIQQSRVDASASMDEKVAAMSQQVVLFANSRNDITDDVAKLLDVEEDK